MLLAHFLHVSNAAINIIASTFFSTFSLSPWISLYPEYHAWYPVFKTVLSSQSNQAAWLQRSLCLVSCLASFISTVLLSSCYGLPMGLYADIHTYFMCFSKTGLFPFPYHSWGSLSHHVSVVVRDHLILSLGIGLAQAKSSPLFACFSLGHGLHCSSYSTAICLMVLVCHFSPSPSCLYPCRFQIQWELIFW